MNELVESLKKIRSNSRKLRRDYLIAHNLFNQIESIIPDTHYSTKEKIDIIILNVYDKCYCGNLTKPNSKFCSITCRNKDPSIRKSIGIKNSLNAATRTIKLKETLKSKYGVTAVQDIPAVKEKTRIKKLSYYANVLEESFMSRNLNYSQLSNHEYLKLICDKSSYQEISKQHFNNMPPMTIWRHFERIGFDPKFEKSSSAAEREIATFINTLGFNTLLNDRSIIKPKELDIFIPSKNLAIEYHGLYWHSGNPKAHTIKRELCQKIGITLMQIYEDEWLFKRPIVESMIRHRLGLSSSIYARRTSIKYVDSAIAKHFLEANHIQGPINGMHIGLYHNHELVCLMSIGKSRFSKHTELLRFCNKLNTSVVGGFSKLLKKAKKTYPEIITYADLRYSDGALYEQNGKFLRKTKPGYYWVDKNQQKRINRFQTQKHKLSKLLGAKFDASKTEQANMIEAGYLQIWDCGHNVYIL